MVNQKYSSAATSINSNRAPAVYSNKRAIAIMSNSTVLDVGSGKYDTAVNLAQSYDVSVISNVLNVINEREARQDVIRLAAKRSRTILITVYEGDASGIGRQTGDDQWQESRKTADYVSEVQDALNGWTVKRHGKLIIAKSVV